MLGTLQTYINGGSTEIIDKRESEELTPINSEVSSKTDVSACEPKPASTEGNNKLTTIRRFASKYPDVIPVLDKTSKSVIHALLQGSIFPPQGNTVERFHRTVKRVLNLCIEAAPNWEVQVPAALFALRTVTHESTGFSPAKLVHGNNLRTLVTLLYESWLDSEEKEDTVVEYVFELNRLKKCRDLATVRMEEVRDRRKKWYDKNAIKREFQQGDAVLVLTLNQPHKLAPQWKAPGKTNLVEHDIDLFSDKHVQHKPYRMTNRQNEILKTEIERMLIYKIIEPGLSEYTSPMILVETTGRDPVSITENETK
ncbi:retrovirus-related Pol polyprotein from transposon 17.6 [Trichonephila clavipes]|nr:retrovirus-related Pol polyprotein from transposon 17.6 [Trichonephila clavipes]